MKRFTLGILAAGAALVLAACGGGGADTTPRAKVTAVKVFGDSLQDVGTFGVKFTVDGGPATKSTVKVFAERVADSYGVSGMCNFYTIAGASVTTTPTCGNFAIGGGVVNHLSASAPLNVANSPLKVANQLATSGQVGAFTDTDLLVIDGGGNDGAALVGAYLGVVQTLAAQPAGVPAALGKYQALIAAYVSPAEVTAMNTALAQINPANPATVQAFFGAMAAAGSTYMTALGTEFGTQIDTLAVKKGAKKVVVLNMPDILLTPRFQFFLSQLGPQRATFEPIFASWVAGFNTALKGKVSALPEVALVDFYQAFQDQVKNPEQFGLTDVTTPVCPATGPGSWKLPCSAAEAAAVNPKWTTAAFSDGFHPTPYGHQLVAQLISRALAQKGWI